MSSAGTGSHNFQPVPGYFERKPDPDMGTTTPHCINRPDGKHFCMAHQTLVASKGGLILLMIEDDRQALFIEMTPEGIRQLCGDLLNVAAKVEAQHVATSNTQLAEALAKPPDEKPDPAEPA